MGPKSRKGASQIEKSSVHCCLSQTAQRKSPMIKGPINLQTDFIMISDLIISKLSEMSFYECLERVQYFVQRIKESFELQEDTQNIIFHKKKVNLWLQEEISKLRQEKQKINSAGGLQGLLNLAGLSATQMKKMDSSETILLKIKENLKNELMEFEDTDLAQFTIPQEILESFHFLHKKRMPSYFGIASCPLMKNCFIMKKESYDRCVTKVTLNQLKCVNLGSETEHVIQYQRYMIEHFFNRLFDQDSQLTTVLKIQIENKHSDKVIEIFCCIEDLVHKPSFIKSLSSLEIDNFGQKMCVKHEDKQCNFDDISLFHALMIQLSIVPIQTVVSDYVLTKEQGKDRFKVTKMHYKQSEKDDIFAFMKQHCSLRNPLTFFNNFIKYHEFKIDTLKSILNPVRLYANFYEILNIIFRLLQNDFTVKHGEGRSHSICINNDVFQIIWNIFQEMVVLSNWLDEVINPIKEYVTMAEIKNKLYPIFNEIIQITSDSFEQYQNNMLNFPIENYLSSNVSKVNIQKYKDRYININWIQPITFNSKTDIFNSIFAKTLKDYDLRNTNIYESIYFLNFISSNYTELYENSDKVSIHLSWKRKKLWKEIIQLRNNEFEQLNYLSISLDLLALTFDFDSLEFTNNPFESIKNELDESRLLEITRRIHMVLKLKYEKKCDNYLSFLIEKSFKYKKYDVVKYLIESGVHIKHYEDIFTHQKEASTKSSMVGRSYEKQKLIELMQVKDPEMFRRFRWQELINVKLKRQESDGQTTQLITVDKGRFYVNKKVYSHLTSKSLMSNTLSRKDYMFCNNRLIAKVTIEGVNSYIELTEYPLLRYFYSLFFKQLDKESLILNFTGFFSEKGVLLHLIECIPECFNFQKGLQYQNESDLKNFISEDDLSEAIILSMILMPTNIQLKNIIISPQLQNLYKNSKKGLFIVDFFDFYQKNGFQVNGGNIALKIKNSLFLFDEMHNSISTKLLKKYSEMNVMEIINGVFTRCSSFIRQINTIRPRKQEFQRQLYSLIFQNGYAFALAERMFKIKNAFQNKLKDKLSIDHFDLLEIINPQLRYYYEEIMRSSNQLIEREKNMLDESFKHSFIVSDKLVSFFAKGTRLATEIDNFPQHYMKFNFQGPSQNLKHLHEDALKFTVFQDKITSYKFFNHEIIEYFIRHIDLSRYSKEERQELFDKLQEYSLDYLKNEKNALPLSVIRITYVEGLKERKLKFSDERLKDLIFENVSCTEGEFNRLIKKYQNISHLELRGVSNLQKIGELYVNAANSLEIKNLKTLSITGCPNLQTVDIKCDELQHLTLRSNSALTHIYINSKKLQNMDCSQCNKLRLENIGIYIFQKINVLLCKNSCDGDVKRLEHENYSIYLTRILRYLCNRFQESNQYKLDLVITLNKLELLDQKFYRFGNTRMSSNLASLLNFITKAARQTLRITQRQIIEIFLANTRVDVLSVDELLKVQMDSLTNIVDCLRITRIRKEFKQINFRQVIKTPLLFHEHLRLIKEMFECVNVDKVFLVRLTVFPQIETEYYIALIDLINRKQNLQKLQISFENSFIDYQFLQHLFSLKEEKNKICKIQFIDCELQINENVQFDKQPAMKDLIINRCKLGSLTFVQKFINLNTLQLNSCTIENNLISPFYLAIAKLQNLKSLSLVGLKPKIFEKDLQLSFMFQLFKNLAKLEELDFSGNRLNYEELSQFSSKINSLHLKQLVLNDFYDPDICSYFQNFLYHESLRIIHIEFKIKLDTQILESFINEISSNRSIIKLKIKTDREIPSEFCQKLKQNKTLEQIQSNQPIPNWLKNHIASNSQSNQSGIFESEPFQVLVSNNNKKEEDFYRIGLSLDGGGVRGLLLATQLDYICKNVKQPLHKIFDCVGGTSIGGILALASTGTLDGQHPVCSTKDLMDIFEVYGNRIFKKSQIKQLTNLFDTKYDVSSFEDLLSSYLKDSKLSDTLRETNVVITAVNRLTNEDMIFRSINAIFDRNKDFYMRDIARATSAAPTYFPSAEIKNVNATEKYSLIDGGVGLNNPSKLVIDDIIKTTNSGSKNNYFLLSLGTGRLKCEVIPESAGIVNLAPIIDSFTESANFFIEKDLSENYKGHYMRLSPLINMNRKDAQLDNTSPEVLKVYKETGEAAAEEEFSNKIAYGKFKNESFIEWLAQNTARKYDI